jgi:D-alanine-D-alanine ligase
VEPLCKGREFTVGLLGDRALAVLEIVPAQDFLSYACKYSPDGAQHICPAPIPVGLERLLRELARRAFAACGCRDWARVDFLLDPAGQPYFLEINAIPGFTATSLYPDSAAGAGLSPAKLLRTLVARAWEDRP